MKGNSVTHELAGNIWLLIAEYWKDNDNAEGQLEAIEKSLEYFQSPKAYWLLGKYYEKKAKMEMSIENFKKSARSVTKIMTTESYNSTEAWHDFSLLKAFVIKILV